MPKRKKASSKDPWKHLIKTLEKPNVTNHLLEYLCNLKNKRKTLDKKITHRDWLESISLISKKHESVRIRKLADEAVKNFKKEFQSQAVVNFWQNVDDQRKRENIGKDLFFMHFEGFTELVQNRNNDSIHKSEDDESEEDYDYESEDEVDPSQKEDDANSESDESDLEEEYYAHIIDLDNVPEQRRPSFCSDKEWSAITSISKPSVDLPPSVERQLENYLKIPEIKKIRESFDSYEEVTTDEDKYARRIIDHYIFCLENRPEYFAKRPQTEATFRVRFIEPIIKPFIFIFKDLMDMTWGEITSLSSANRRNYQLAKGKRKRIGSKADGIGSLVDADDKELMIIELSGAPTRLPTRHPEGDYVCEFELAKKLKVFGLQTEVGRGIYCIRTLSQFHLPTRISDLCYLYELLRAMFLLRDELIKSLRVIQDLKIAKARKLEVIDPISSYILRIPPS
ncbi:14114_t:CDS:2 [Funneliformis caledonium]|uniref:14114_t:CDS:1 n=1 Tax=Funneliformis caledonium TaxID=1117310 RepID=A0A9N9FZI5_9GLOM|nr:14114_t:CDS:2 [Funneliformis caledonium]